MITGIQDVYYNVKDMDKAVAFYVQALTFKKTFGDQWWTSLDLGGFKLGLHGSEGQDIPHIPRDSHGTHAGGTLTLRSDNIQEDKERIEKFGGKILGDIDAEWGHMLIFEDLDGNVLKLMKPKY